MMLSLIQMSLQVCVTLTVLCLMLPNPTTSSLNIFGSFKPLDLLENKSTKDHIHMPVFNKRETSGADPWSLCPNSMERVDCFLEYLRVYARLRKATSGSNSFSVRNIGKRSSYTSSKFNPCLDGLNSYLCFLIHLDTSMNNFDKDTVEKQGQNDADNFQ